MARGMQAGAQQRAARRRERAAWRGPHRPESSGHGERAAAKRRKHGPPPHKAKQHNARPHHPARAPPGATTPQECPARARTRRPPQEHDPARAKSSPRHAASPPQNKRSSPCAWQWRRQQRETTGEEEPATAHTQRQKAMRGHGSPACRKRGTTPPPGGERDHQGPRTTQRDDPRRPPAKQRRRRPGQWRPREQRQTNETARQRHTAARQGDPRPHAPKMATAAVSAQERSRLGSPGHARRTGDSEHPWWRDTCERTASTPAAENKQSGHAHESERRRPRKKAACLLANSVAAEANEPATAATAAAKSDAASASKRRDATRDTGTNGGDGGSSAAAAPAATTANDLPLLMAVVLGGGGVAARRARRATLRWGWSSRARLAPTDAAATDEPAVGACAKRHAEPRKQRPATKSRHRT